MLNYQALTVQAMHTQGHVNNPVNLISVCNKITAQNALVLHCEHQTALLMQELIL